MTRLSQNIFISIVRICIDYRQGELFRSVASSHSCRWRKAETGQQRTPVSFTEQRQVIEIVREAQTEIQA